MAWHPTLRPRPPWCIRLPPRPHPQPGRGLGDRDIVGSRVSDLKRPSIRLQGASYLSTTVLPIGSGHGLLSTSVLVTGWPAGGVGRGHRARAQGAGCGSAFPASRESGRRSRAGPATVCFLVTLLGSLVASQLTSPWGTSGCGGAALGPFFPPRWGGGRGAPQAPGGF